MSETRKFCVYDSEGYPIGPFDTADEAESWIRNAAARLGITAQAARDYYYTTLELVGPMTALSELEPMDENRKPGPRSSAPPA